MPRNSRTSSRDKTPAKPEGPSIGATESEEQSPFRYLVKGEKVRRDGAFFELLLARVILEKGSVNDFDQLWPKGTQALAGLNLRYLSKQSSKEISDLVNSVGGEFTERLGNRTRDLSKWVTELWEVIMVYGSIRQYLRSFDTDGPEVLIEDLSKRLSGLTPKFIIEYLRESGEKIPTLSQLEQVDEKPSRQGRQRGGNRGRQGRGQRRGRGRNDKAPSAPQQNSAATTEDKPDPKQTEKSVKSESSNEGNRQRRGRRGFFRNRRGGRGKRPAQPEQTQQKTQSNS